IVLAVIPVALYYLGVFFGVHFEARRTGVLATPREFRPGMRGVLKRIHLIAPLVVIIYLLLEGRSPANAALFGILTALVASLTTRATRMSPKQIATLFENGARAALPVIAACATAGI